MNIQKIDSIETVKAELKKNGFCIGLVNPRQYHEWKRELKNCVSKSSLTDFMKDKYEHRWKQLEKENRRQKGEKDPESTAIRTGKLWDCVILTPELFNQEYVKKDEELNLKTKDGRARRDEILASGKEIVTEEEYNHAVKASEVVYRGLAQHTKDDGYRKIVNEYRQVAIWTRITKIDETKLAEPLILCGMLDIFLEGQLYNEDGELTENMLYEIIDLKTTSSDLKDHNEMRRDIWKYKYAVQAAIYRDLVKVACKANNSNVSFTLLFVTTNDIKKAPIRRGFVFVSDSALRHAQEEYKEALVNYAEAVASGDWGNESVGYFTYYTPDWANKA